MPTTSTWGKQERMVLFIAWLGWTFDIMDTAIFNLSKVRMVTELLGGQEAYLKSGAGMEARLLTIFLLAWSLGGLLFGWLSDRFGRARVLTWTILLYSVATGMTALCHNWWQLSAVRFVPGLGIGGEWAAGAAWVAESVPDSTRAKAASWLQSAAAFGPALAALANIGLAGFDWRAMFVIGALPALMVFAVRRTMTLETTPPSTASEIKPRLEGRTLFTMIAALLLGTAGIAAATNVSFWFPNLVMSLSPNVEPLVLAQRQSTATWSLHVGTFAGVFLIPWLCGVIGRKVTIAICLVTSPILVACIAGLAINYTTLVVLAPLLSLFSIGIGAAFALYFPELFPQAFRATGAGLAYNGGRIVAAVFPLMTAMLISSTHGNIALSMAVTGFIVAIGAVVLLFLPETRGKPLPN